MIVGVRNNWRRVPSKHRDDNIIQYVSNKYVDCSYLTRNSVIINRLLISYTDIFSALATEIALKVIDQQDAAHQLLFVPNACRAG